MYFLQIALIAGIVITAAALINEVVGWRRRTSAVSGRQMTLRVCAGLLLIALFGLVLAGSVVGVFVIPRPGQAVKNLIPTIAYLCACLGVACLLVLIALLDIREVLRTYKRDWREMRRDLERKDGPEQ